MTPVALLTLLTACSDSPPEDLGEPYLDVDGDGYESTETGGDDCDDSDPTVNIAAAEVCNGADDDCDGLVDDDDDSLDTSTGDAWYLDGDGDGWGTGDALWACEDPSDATASWASTDLDCDDGDPTIAPSADEVCNGVDDDCDDKIDEEDPSWDEASGTAWYMDRDSDGHGAGSATIACEDPTDDVRDWTTTSDDCDDTDANVYPGAPEICNGIDDDCDSTNSEVGTAGWYSRVEGSWTNLTETLGAGMDGAPVAWTVSEAGSLWLCEGTWYATIDVQADLDIVAPGGPTVTMLDGGGAGTVLTVDGDDIAVSVTSVTLQGGEGSGAPMDRDGTAGGGVFCAGDSYLDMDGCNIVDNTADYGAGLYVEDCTVTLYGTNLRDNSATLYGGGISVLGGLVALTNGEISGNVSDGYGGGLAIGAWSEDASVELEGTPVTDNEGEYGGGAMLEHGGELTCTGTTSDEGGLFANVGGYGGGVLFYGDGALVSDGCDWGEAGTELDNSPDDVASFSVPGDTIGSYGDDATFECDDAACAE